MNPTSRMVAIESGVPITTSATWATSSLSVHSIAALQTNWSSVQGLDAASESMGPSMQRSLGHPSSSPLGV